MARTVTIAMTVLTATKVTMATMVMIPAEYSGYHNVLPFDWWYPSAPASKIILSTW